MYYLTNNTLPISGVTDTARSVRAVVRLFKLLGWVFFLLNKGATLCLHQD